MTEDQVTELIRDQLSRIESQLVKLNEQSMDLIRDVAMIKEAGPRQDKDIVELGHRVGQLEETAGSLKKWLYMIGGAGVLGTTGSGFLHQWLTAMLKALGG